MGRAAVKRAVSTCDESVYRYIYLDLPSIAAFSAFTGFNLIPMPCLFLIVRGVQVQMKGWPFLQSSR